VLDRSDNRCFVGGFLPFLHHAEPVEFPLPFGHRWRERELQVSWLLHGRPGPGFEQETPALQLAS
jgi:hypothetical protein